MEYIIKVYDDKGKEIDYMEYKIWEDLKENFEKISWLGYVYDLLCYKDFKELILHRRFESYYDLAGFIPKVKTKNVSNINLCVDGEGFCYG